MKKLRRDFERFCYNHQGWGIRNLMLYVAIGNVLVYFLTMADSTELVYSLLRFDRDAILNGQVWRLFSYVFTYMLDGNLISTALSLLMLFFYYQFGQMLENQWGVLRFNLYYLCGIILTDIGALALGWVATVEDLNLTLFLAVATLLPELRFLIFFVIPIKAKYLALVYLGLSLLNMAEGLALMIRFLDSGIVYLIWLMPLFALANYFLFFGSDIMNILPYSLRYRRRRSQKPHGSSQPNPNWAQNYRSKTGEKPYRHKCTVCGRTDTENPGLEFRYCSRCNGYYCYCMDHINNHVHIT